MVLVFIFLGIIIISLSFFIILLFSTIQISIEKLKINTNNIKKINDDYKIRITLYFLKKIPLLIIKLNNSKIKKIYKNNKFNKIDINNKLNKMNINKKDIFRFIKIIKINIKSLDLKINLSLEDCVITSYIIVIISSIIGIILPFLAKENIYKCHYIINSKYTNKNEFYMSLDSIFQIKIVHIICSIIFFIKKGRDLNDRTSNRRSYVNSNG